MHKLFLRCMCIVLLVMLLSGTLAYADYELPQFVRIGLQYGNGATSSVTLQSDYGFQLGTYQGREFVRTAAVMQTQVTVSLNGTTLEVKAADGTVLHSASGSVGIKPDASGMQQKIVVNDVEYRGAVDCIAKEGAITVVNVVFMDHYLYGVISREMSPSWPDQALKAQAVCARNYVASNLEKHGNDGFDLCSGVHCQAYSGTNVEAEGSYLPVDDTTRQVLTYDDALAQLYYSASMGATTEDVQYVWGNSVPYLISVDNSYEDTENIPNGKWTGTLTADEATTLMRNKGYDVGDVTKIEVLEYTPNGRVLKMQVTGTSGSKVFERESCRTLFNTVTKSQMFTVKGNGEGGISVPSIKVTDGADVAVQPIDKIMLLSGAGRFMLDIESLFVISGTEEKSYTKTETRVGQNTEFYFEGSGWGHSVGMSQYGAKGMAEAGFDYVEILLHYFPGTNLENAY